MSRIVNEATNKNPLIVGIREQLEHRALTYIPLMTKVFRLAFKRSEAYKAGLSGD